eukprot:g6159.t1
MSDDAWNERYLGSKYPPSHQVVYKVDVTNGGSGYTAGNLSFSGGNCFHSPKFSFAVDGSGTITGTTMVDYGTCTVLPTSVSPMGSGGSGAQFTIQTLAQATAKGEECPTFEYKLRSGSTVQDSAGAAFYEADGSEITEYTIGAMTDGSSCDLECGYTKVNNVLWKLSGSKVLICESSATGQQGQYTNGGDIEILSTGNGPTVYERDTICARKGGTVSRSLMGDDSNATENLCDYYGDGGNASQYTSTNLYFSCRKCYEGCKLTCDHLYHNICMSCDDGYHWSKNNHFDAWFKHDSTDHGRKAWGSLSSGHQNEWTTILTGFVGFRKDVANTQQARYEALYTDRSRVDTTTWAWTTLSGAKKTAARNLGYNRHSWDHFVLERDFDNKKTWESIATKAQRKHMKVLRYNPAYLSDLQWDDQICNYQSSNCSGGSCTWDSGQSKCLGGRDPNYLMTNLRLVYTITSVGVTDAGSGYTDGASVVFSWVSGSWMTYCTEEPRATITLDSTGNNGIGGVTIINGGKCAVLPQVAAVVGGTGGNLSKPIGTFVSSISGNDIATALTMRGDATNYFEVDDALYICDSKEAATSQLWQNVNTGCRTIGIVGSITGTFEAGNQAIVFKACSSAQNQSSCEGNPLDSWTSPGMGAVCQWSNGSCQANTRAGAMSSLYKRNIAGNDVDACDGKTQAACALSSFCVFNQYCSYAEQPIWSQDLGFNDTNFPNAKWNSARWTTAYNIKPIKFGRVVVKDTQSATSTIAIRPETYDGGEGEAGTLHGGSMQGGDAVYRGSTLLGTLGSGTSKTQLVLSSGTVSVTAGDVLTIHPWSSLTTPEKTAATGLGWNTAELWETPANCAPCSGNVTNAAANASYTCDSADDIKVSACATGYYKKVGGTDGKRDTCACQTLTVTNGTVSYDETSGVASYTCNTGYQKQGAATATCNGSVFSPTSLGTCVESACTLDSLNVSNGTVSYNSSTKVATFSCDAGYFKEGTATATCSGGSFNPSSLGTCNETTGRATCTGTGKTAGAGTCVCQSDYSGTIGWNEVSGWSGTCKLKAKPCDASVAPKNGTVGECSVNLKSGSSCKPVCNSNYVLSVATGSSCNDGVLSAVECVPAFATGYRFKAAAWSCSCPTENLIIQKNSHNGKLEQFCKAANCVCNDGYEGNVYYDSLSQSIVNDNKSGGCRVKLPVYIPAVGVTLGLFCTVVLICFVDFRQKNSSKVKPSRESKSTKKDEMKVESKSKGKKKTVLGNDAIIDIKSKPKKKVSVSFTRMKD